MKRRIISFVLSGILVVALCALGVFFTVEKSRIVIGNEITYYFLARTCEDTTVSAVVGNVYGAGGAGYYLSEKNLVVLACYEREEDAIAVQTGLSVSTKILPISAKKIILYGRKRESASDILRNINVVERCAGICYDVANRLERGEITQEGARGALNGAITALNDLCKNGGEFSKWNTALSRAIERGEEVKNGILFSKDLRYLQIELCRLRLSAKDFFA